MTISPFISLVIVRIDKSEMAAGHMTLLPKRLSAGTHLGLGSERAFCLPLVGKSVSPGRFEARRAGPSSERRHIQRVCLHARAGMELRLP